MSYNLRFKIPNLSYLRNICILFVIYFLTARFGLRLDAVSGFATLVWIPTGISLIALLLFGTKLWPGIALGAFMVNYLNGASVPVAVGIGVGNTLEGVLGAYLLKKLASFNPNIESLQDALSLIFIGAMLSTGVSATIGTLSLLLGGIIASQVYVSTWVAWWVGDMMSNLILVPFLLTWRNFPTATKDPKRILEIVLLVITIIGIGIVIFTPVFGSTIKSSPLTYIAYLPIMWAALRFGPRETSAATFLLTSFAITTTIFGFGPFIQRRLSESLLYLQSFIAIISTSSLLLAAAIAERKVLEKQKDEFFSIASHELKTPITSLKVYGEILEERLRKKRFKEIRFATKMNEQIAKVIVLINDMLDLSRISVEKLKFNYKKINIGKLVKRTVADFRYMTTTHTIQLKGDFKKSVMCDEERIGQVLINLLTNAIKYSPKAKKVVVYMQEADGKVVIRVRDFGIGIHKKEQVNIFKRFVRIGGDNNDSPTGFGLGLYISSEIIKRHGGTIWVDSQEGKGSTFSFALPYFLKISLTSFLT